MIDLRLFANDFECSQNVPNKRNDIELMLVFDAYKNGSDHFLPLDP